MNAFMHICSVEVPHSFAVGGRTVEFEIEGLSL